MDVTTAPAFSAGKPHLLFEGPFVLGPIQSASYDVAANGRFLMLKPQPPTSEPLIVLLNWSDELKRLTQTGK